MKRSGVRHVLILLVLVIAAVAAVVYLRDSGLLGRPTDGATGASSASNSEGRRSAVVERVVDGDTIVVQLDGVSERVRLLNIDTPESVDPDREVECLGPAASTFLAGLLPEGALVTLEFDTEQRDRYDRLLAGVFTDDGDFVNAEVARAGFADVVVFEPNDLFEPDIRSAVSEARAARLGLWADPLVC